VLAETALRYCSFSMRAAMSGMSRTRYVALAHCKIHSGSSGQEYLMSFRALTAPSHGWPCRRTCPAMSSAAGACCASAGMATDTPTTANSRLQEFIASAAASSLPQSISGWRQTVKDPRSTLRSNPSWITGNLPLRAPARSPRFGLLIYPPARHQCGPQPARGAAPTSADPWLAAGFLLMHAPGC